MTSPISARIPPELRQELARYCVERDLSQTDAIAAGLKLLLDQPQPASTPSPEQAMRELDALAQALADKLAGFDPEVAEEDGRD